MTKCSCFRLSDDTKFVLEQVRAEVGFKSVAQLIRELCWFISHGRNFPGSLVDMKDLLTGFIAGEFIGKDTIKDRVAYRDVELTRKYLSILDEVYGDQLLSLMASQGVGQVLDPTKNQWSLNIQHTLMERCDVGLLDSEVKELCLQWFREAKSNGRISEIQKGIISKQWSEKCNRAEGEA